MGHDAGSGLPRSERARDEPHGVASAGKVEPRHDHGGLRGLAAGRSGHASSGASHASRRGHQRALHSAVAESLFRDDLVGHGSPSDLILAWSNAIRSMKMYS